MNTIKKIPATILASVLAIVFPFVVITLITSKTPAILGIRSFVVLSGSMQPLFPVGSIIYARRQQVYKVGDVITYKTTNNQNVTHRIYSLSSEDDGATYITKGDTNNAPDTYPVKSSQIIGKVFFFVPVLGKVISLLKTPIYFFLLIIIPSLVFIGAELWNIKKEIVRSTEKRLLEKIKTQIESGGKYEIDFK